MRSSAGVGITPPNVPGEPKPQSSVMMSRMLGAPLGGTTVGGHHGVDSVAFSLITPPNFGSGGGSCLPLMVVVALGAPMTPVVCISAQLDGASEVAKVTVAVKLYRNRLLFFIFVFLILGPLRANFILWCDVSVARKPVWRRAGFAGISVS